MKPMLAMVIALGLGLMGGAPGRAQTIEEALVAAYLTNPDLQAQRAALRATDELVRRRSVTGAPTVAVDSGIARSTSTARTGGLAEHQGGLAQARSADLQRRRNGGQHRARGERSPFGTGSPGRLRAECPARCAATVYTNLLAAEAVLDFAIQNENRLRRQLQATQDRFEVGEVTRTDVAQADARLSGAIADRVRAEGELTAARADYRRVINQEPGRQVVPEPLRALPDSEVEAQQLAEVNNPNITIAQFDLAAARRCRCRAFSVAAAAFG